MLSGALGCTGAIGDSVEDAEGAVDGPPGSELPQVDAPGSDDELRGASENGFRRLTRSELSATIEDLFGPEFHASIKLQLNGLPADVIKSPDQFVPFLSGTHVDSALRLALVMADKLVEPGALGSLVDPCVATAQPDDACLNTFFSTFGLKVYRRPLSDLEIQSMITVVRDGTTVTEGLSIALARMFMAPDFLFHIERGTPGVVAPGHVLLTPYEVASRIAYRTAGTMPDAELLAAAAEGQLQTLEAVRQHVARLVESPRGHENVRSFFSYWLNIADSGQLNADMLMRAGLDGEGLYTAMVEETNQFVNHLVYESDAPFSSLLLSPLSFPTSPALAQIYGTNVWSGAGAPSQTSGERTGILMRGPLLASNSEQTKPIARGINLLRRVLCQEIELPDPEFLEQNGLGAVDLTREEASTREIFEAKTAPPVCQACHQFINPLGFALEAYDTLGMYRQSEDVYQNGEFVVSHPINTQVDNARLSSEPTPLSGAGDLMQSLARSKRVPECVAERLFGHARLREPTATDELALADMVSVTGDESRLIDLFITAVANEDIFYRSPYEF